MSKFRPYVRDQQRGVVSFRTITVLSMLTSHPQTLAQLTERSGLCAKTIRRYIQAMEESGVPVIVEGWPPTYSIMETGWLRRYFARHEHVCMFCDVQRQCAETECFMTIHKACGRCETLRTMAP